MASPKIVAQGKFMAFRIMEGVRTYQEVISKRADLKVHIDRELRDNGREDLIPAE